MKLKMPKIPTAEQVAGARQESGLGDVWFEEHCPTLEAARKTKSKEWFEEHYPNKMPEMLDDPPGTCKRCGQSTDVALKDLPGWIKMPPSEGPVILGRASLPAPVRWWTCLLAHRWTRWEGYHLDALACYENRERRGCSVCGKGQDRKLY